MPLIEEIYRAFEDLRGDEAGALVKKAIEMGLDPSKVLQDGVVAGVRVIGDKFQKGEYFLPELILGAIWAKTCIGLITPHLSKEQGKKKGKVVIGTVKGDVHDIGKNIVALTLTVAGFEVYDLGIDVPTMAFIDKAEEVGADIIALSALLSVTVPTQGEVIRYLVDLGIRDKYKVMIGGGPTTKPFADSIGADGWGETAGEVVSVAESLMR